MKTCKENTKGSGALGAIAAGVILTVVASIVAVGLFPTISQHFTASAQCPAKEFPYTEHKIIEVNSTGSPIWNVEEPVCQNSTTDSVSVPIFRYGADQRGVKVTVNCTLGSWVSGYFFHIRNDASAFSVKVILRLNLTNSESPDVLSDLELSSQSHTTRFISGGNIHDNAKLEVQLVSGASESITFRLRTAKAGTAFVAFTESYMVLGDSNASESNAEKCEGWTFFADKTIEVEENGCPISNTDENCTYHWPDVFEIIQAYYAPDHKSVYIKVRASVGDSWSASGWYIQNSVNATINVQLRLNQSASQNLQDFYEFYLICESKNRSHKYIEHGNPNNGALTLTLQPYESAKIDFKFVLWTNSGSNAKLVFGEYVKWS